MALIQFSVPWTLGEQPDVPELNWDDPITQGLLGFMWMGGRGTPRELVPAARGTYTILQTGTQHLARRGGSASVWDGTATNGVYTARNAYGTWKPSDAPITFLIYGDHTTPASSRPLCGTPVNSQGWGLQDLYGARNRYVSAYVGGTNRTAQAGTWDNGLSVRGLSATTTQLRGWENGVEWATTSYSTTSALSYDNTYGRLFTGGNPDSGGAAAGYGYWMALWSRELTPAEHQRIANDPLCMLVQRVITVATASASGSVGTFTVNADNALLSATGTTTALGTFSNTLASATLTSSGTTTIIGVVNSLLADASLTASGAVGGISGTFNVPTSKNVTSISGTTTILGVASASLSDATMSASGTTQIVGTFATILQNATLAASGTSGDPPDTSTWRTLTNVGQ